MPPALILLVMGLVIGVTIALIVPPFFRSALHPKLRRRLKRYAHYTPPDAPSATASVGGVLGRAVDDTDGAIRRALRVRIVRAGGAPALRFVLLIALLGGVLVALAGIRIGVLGGLHAALAGAAATTGLFIFLVHRREAAWRTQFLDNFNDAVGLIIRAVRAGIPVSEAIRQAGTEVNEPVRAEFRRVADSMDLGVDMRDALRQAGERVRLPEFDFFVVALILQRETGGQLSDTLEDLTIILRRRKEIRLKVRAITAEGRTTAAVVGSLPIAIGGLMMLINPENMERLAAPGIGRHMLIYGTVSMVVGFAVINLLCKVRT